MSEKLLHPAFLLAVALLVIGGAGAYLWCPRAAEPDQPINFGYKCTWLAVHGATPEALAEVLGLKRVRASNWKNGVRAAYDGRVFVTPPLAGWVLVVTAFLPDPGDRDHPDEATAFLAGLGRRFREVQYFGTHRVVSFVAWARLVEGTFVRKFAYLGERDEIIWNDGTATTQEAELDLVFSAHTEEWQHYPDEQDVMALARAWSIDPSALEAGGFPAGVGLLGCWGERKRTLPS